MKEVYAVLCCNKFKKEGKISQDCYSTLEKAQEFCSNRYNTRKVNEMYYSSEDYDYYIQILSIK